MRQVDERVTSHRDTLRFWTVERVAMHRIGQVEHACDDILKGTLSRRYLNDHAPFDISGDMIEYVDADQSMTAEGHSIVVQGSSTLKADHLRYERESQRLFARGHVFQQRARARLGEPGVIDGAIHFDHCDVVPQMGLERVE